MLRDAEHWILNTAKKMISSIRNTIPIAVLQSRIQPQHSLHTIDQCVAVAIDVRKDIANYVSIPRHHTGVGTKYRIVELTPYYKSIPLSSSTESTM